MTPRKMTFVCGDVTLTFTPGDIDAVWQEWEAAHPGKRADLDMPQQDFVDACMKRLKASARPTRTVIHN